MYATFDIDSIMTAKDDWEHVAGSCRHLAVWWRLHCSAAFEYINTAFDILHTFLSNSPPQSREFWCLSGVVIVVIPKKRNKNNTNMKFDWKSMIIIERIENPCRSTPGHPNAAPPQLRLCRYFQGQWLPGSRWQCVAVHSNPWHQRW